MHLRRQGRDDVLLLDLGRPHRERRGRLASGTPIPYLVSVADPYDSASPHHRWGPVTFTAARLPLARSACAARCSTCGRRCNRSGPRGDARRVSAARRRDERERAADVRDAARPALDLVPRRRCSGSTAGRGRVVYGGARAALTGVARGPAGDARAARRSGARGSGRPRSRRAAGGASPSTVKPLVRTELPRRRRRRSGAPSSASPWRRSCGSRSRRTRSRLRGTVQAACSPAPTVVVQRLDTGASGARSRARLVDGAGRLRGDRSRSRRAPTARAIAPGARLRSGPLARARSRRAMRRAARRRRRRARAARARRAGAAARFAVGVEPRRLGRRPSQSASTRCRARSVVSRDLLALGALTVETAPSGARCARLRGVAYVERLDRRPAHRVRPERPARRRRQWYLRRDARVRRLGAPPPLAAGARRGDRLGHRREAPGARGPDRGRRGASSAATGGSTSTATGRSSPASSRAEANNGEGIAGIAFGAELLVAKVVRARRLDLARGGGEGDPLGRPARARA